MTTCLTCGNPLPANPDGDLEYAFCPAHAQVERERRARLATSSFTPAELAAMSIADGSVHDVLPYTPAGWLRLQRRKLRLTQKQMADALGMSRNQYERLECSARLLLLSEVETMAAVCGCGADAVIEAMRPVERAMPGPRKRVAA